VLRHAFGKARTRGTRIACYERPVSSRTLELDPSTLEIAMASKQQGNASNGKQGKSAPSRSSGNEKSAGGMSVREAGQKGGQRVRELVSEGRQNEKRH
jgi:fructose-1,6-bisphosphatase/inositol monophosphatase family enzyme